MRVCVSSLHLYDLTSQGAVLSTFQTLVIRQLDQTPDPALLHSGDATGHSTSHSKEMLWVALGSTAITLFSAFDGSCTDLQIKSHVKHRDSRSKSKFKLTSRLVSLHILKDNVCFEDFSNLSLLTQPRLRPPWWHHSDVISGFFFSSDLTPQESQNIEKLFSQASKLTYLCKIVYKRDHMGKTNWNSKGISISKGPFAFFYIHNTNTYSNISI